MVLANIFAFDNPVTVAIIAGVIILLFGGSKLPGLMRSLGEGMKELKKASREISGSDAPESKPVEAQSAPASAAPPVAEASAPATQAGQEK